MGESYQAGQLGEVSLAVREMRTGFLKAEMASECQWACCFPTFLWQLQLLRAAHEPLRQGAPGPEKFCEFSEASRSLCFQPQQAWCPPRLSVSGIRARAEPGVEELMDEECHILVGAARSADDDADGWLVQGDGNGSTVLLHKDLLCLQGQARSSFLELLHCLTPQGRHLPDKPVNPTTPGSGTQPNTILGHMTLNVKVRESHRRRGKCVWGLRPGGSTQGPCSSRPSLHGSPCQDCSIPPSQLPLLQQEKAGLLQELGVEKLDLPTRHPA